MRRQKERTGLAPQLKPGRCSVAMDYVVDFMVKKQKKKQFKDSENMLLDGEVRYF